MICVSSSTDEYFLIAGLGNPGDEYAHTRHNAGFDAIDSLAAAAGVTYWKSQHGALVATFTTTMFCKDNSGRGAREATIVLAKPQSFMNTSGGPVSKIMRADAIDASHLIVVHDDLDLEPGRVRVKLGGRDAGHNGLKSIISKVGSKDFYHIKVGIGRPPGRMPVIDWVLGAPKREAREVFDEACVRAGEAALYLVQHGLVATQDKFN